MSNAYLGLICIFCAVVLDAAANIFLKKSAGFKYRRYGAAAIFLLLAAFALIANAVRFMDLSVVYALFGALGILMTTAVDRIFFGVRLNAAAICGIFIMIFGVILLKTA